MRPPARPSAAALALLAAWSAGAAAPPPVLGEPDADFAGPAQRPLRLPTAVAIAPDGRVCVADGANDRIVIFDSAGQHLGARESFGGHRLSRPLGLRIDRGARLWIADTGHQRILVGTFCGDLLQAAPLARDLFGPVDLSDLAFDPLTDSVWLVNNDGHELIKYDLQTGQAVRIGAQGDAPGQFHYPFMLAAAPNGDLLVSDVINGRVQLLDAAGRPVRALGSYGVDAGQLYRPKGVAFDAAGRPWVSDGVLGVVQVFSPEGGFLDVLRGADGQPLRFDAPCGLAFDEAGRLYVVEQGAGRVRRVRVRLALPPGWSPRPSVLPRRADRQPRACTACHLEWMAPLADGQPTALLAVPDNPPEHPLVSRAATCLSCHDGSVVDSRRRIWQEHGHRTDVQPPADMTVPASLPLVGGRIMCRTCHSAHTRGGSGNLLRDAVFLRVQQHPAELCAGCHAGLAAGPAAGMHPVGPMDLELPPALRHSEHAPARREVTCLACHTAHGAAAEALLALPPETNDLCLACHEPLAPALFSDAVRSAHGRMPALTAEQRAVATAWPTRLGPDATLLCTTCHAAHDAPAPRYLLAFDPAGQDVCAACHPGQRAVIGSAHDLRTNHPAAANVLGVPPTAGGPCSGCHTAHRAARDPQPTPLDPTGRCASCHAAGQLAAARQLGPLNHTTVGCTSCHDPHAGGRSAFITGQPAEHCIACHPDHAALRGGPHDVAARAGGFPAASTATGDTCLACHRPHGDPQSGLYRVAAAAPLAGQPDAACLACHATTAPGTDSREAQVHPGEPASLSPPPELPLATADGRARIACATCHAPHAGPAATAPLLRTAAGQPAEALCLTCHADMASIRTIGHAAPTLTAAGFDAAACQPCHRVHADPASIRAPGLWPRDLLHAGDATRPVPAADQPCLACHRAGGPVAAPPITAHPDVEMFNPQAPEAPGYLPLFDERGAADPHGRIACPTCHLPHGRSTPAPVADLGRPLSERELRARKWHVRSLGPDNVCTTCHGADALRRFMYFHDPQRRGGPLEQAARPGL